MYGSAVPPSSPFPPERTNYCSCVGRHRRDRTNHTYVLAKNFSKPTTPTSYLYLYMPDTDDMTLRDSFTLKQLLHTCLTHPSLGTYIHFCPSPRLETGPDLLLSLSIAIHTIHSLRLRLRLRNCKPKYHTLPYLPRISKLSIHPVRELVAGCSDSRSKTHKRHPGEEIAKDEELPYYPSWVIFQRRRSWCCSMGRWASSSGGGLCLLFMDIMYTCR